MKWDDFTSESHNDSNNILNCGTSDLPKFRNKYWKENWKVDINFEVNGKDLRIYLSKKEYEIQEQN